MSVLNTVAAVDIGGTKIAVALVDRAGTVLDRQTAPTPGHGGPGAVLERVTGLVDALRDRNPQLTVTAVGIGSAGVVHPVAGVVLGATDVLKDWAGTDLRATLTSALGIPVAVRNDVHAHALGEAWRGAGAGRESVLYLAVGTGIGAALIHAGMRGDRLLGAHAAAGHAGHMRSPYAGDLPCTCGGRGHLEAIAAGPALVREYGRRSGNAVADLPAVVRAAHAGDATAREVLELGGTAVGSAIGGLVNMLDPEIVVVGGGVTHVGPPWWEPLLQAVTEDVLPILRTTPVMLSELAEDAPVLGAATIAWTLVEGGTR